MNVAARLIETFQITLAEETTASDRNVPLYWFTVSKITLVVAVTLVTLMMVTSLNLTPDMLFETAIRKSFLAIGDRKDELFSPTNVFEAENEIAVYAFFGKTFVGLPVG